MSPRMPGTKRSRPGGVFLSGQAVSLLGDGLAVLAIPLLVLDLSRDPLALALSAASVTVGYLVVGLPAGVLVDRMDPWRVLVLMDAVRALLFAGLFAFASAGKLTVWLILLIAFAAGACAVFFQTALVVVVKDQFAPARLIRANSVLELANQLSLVAGPAVVGVLAAVGSVRLALLADWLETECRRLGVRIDTSTQITAADLDAARARGAAVILATGSRPATRFTPATQEPATQEPATQEPATQEPVTRHPARRTGLAECVDALSALSGVPLLAGPAVVHDPVGGPVGVAVAELLAAQGRPVTIVTQDQVVGTLLGLSGDLADANVRLQRAGVTRALRSLLREAGGGTARLAAGWAGQQRPCLGRPAAAGAPDAAQPCRVLGAPAQLRR